MNANLVHFAGENSMAGCTFCKLGKNLPEPKESYQHFYQNCPISSYLLQNYFNDFLNHTNIPWENKMSILGAPSNLTEDYSLVLNLEIMTTLHFMYNEKCGKKYPYLRNLRTHLEYYREIYMFSQRYKNAYHKWLDFNPNIV